MKTEHDQFVSLQCKMCPWKCYHLLDCYIQHANNCHKITFAGKATKFGVEDDFFSWSVSNNAPTEDHTVACDLMVGS